MQSFPDTSNLFSIAEARIKQIEHLGLGLTLPAVNQLRYVTCHLLRFDRLEDEQEKQEQLRKANNHCERAIYDAVETGIIYCLEELRDFQKDYRLVVITDIVPSYLDIRAKANEVSMFISKITKDSTGDHCNNRGDHYEKCSKYFDELNGAINILTNARSEINKKLRNWRIGFLLTLGTFILAAITFIMTNCSR
jgi:hypothetical protein